MYAYGCDFSSKCNVVLCLSNSSCAGADLRREFGRHSIAAATADSSCSVLFLQ